MKRKLLIGILLLGIVFAFGFRDRYGPVFWRAVTGGIELVSGNVTLTSGDLTLTSGNIKSSTDIHYPTKTVIKTISLDDDASTDDFQFDDDAVSTTEQQVNLGAIIPAYAEIVSAQIRCFEAVVGGTMSIDLGTASGGAEILGAGATDALNEINSTVAAASPEVIATNAARSVWINATPSANWNTLTAGRYSVMVTYVDYGSVHTVKNP